MTRIRQVPWDDVTHDLDCSSIPKLQVRTRKWSEWESTWETGKGKCTKNIRGGVYGLQNEEDRMKR